MAVALAVVAVTGQAAAQEVQRLPPLAIDRDAVSVSGISSGGYMAAQVHVANSRTIMGAALIAAGPYFCAGDGYPFTLGTALTVCSDFEDLVPFLGPPRVAPSVTEVRRQAADGAIDDTGGLADDRVFLFSGTLDELVPPPVVEAAARFYQAFIDPRQIAFVNTVPAAHAVVTEDFGNRCDVFGPPFINDCDYDTAGALLQHIYGPLAAPIEADGTLIAFDQTEFVANARAARASMNRVGHVYVPEGCADGGCRLHVAFHGCQQFEENIGDAFYARTGYNDWAEANDIVVLYPQTAPSMVRMLGISLPWPNPRGCWDWWGYTGPDYYLKSAVQIRAVKAMIDRLAGR